MRKEQTRLAPVAEREEADTIALDDALDHASVAQFRAAIQKRCGLVRGIRSQNRCLDPTALVAHTRTTGLDHTRYRDTGHVGQLATIAVLRCRRRYSELVGQAMQCVLVRRPPEC